MSTGISEREKLIAAQRFEENMSKYPVEEQIAVALISKNVLNGCSWEFVRANPEIRRNLAAFKASKTCSVQEVTYNSKRGTYGYLLFMQMQRLCDLLGPKNSGPLSDRDLQIAGEHRQEACIALSKRMQKGYKGRIGIFCTNDSQSITVDGKTYPAYAVSFKELMQICVRFNYGVLVKGAVRSPQEVLAHEDAVLKASIVAPSSNALFIDIAPMR